MAKKSQINRNNKRVKMVAKFAAKRAALKATTQDMKVSPEDRFAAQLKLAELPRNSSKVRIHHRCELSGRPKGYYRKVRLSRIALRDLANFGQIPGMTKASWERRNRGYGDHGSHWRSPGAHPQRATPRYGENQVAELASAYPRARCPEGRGLHPRLFGDRVREDRP